MTRLLKLKIGARVNIIVLFICAVTVGIGLFGLSSNNKTNNELNNIYYNSLVPVRHLDEAKAYLHRYRVAMYNHIISTDKKDMDEWHLRASEYKKAVNDNINSYEKTYLTDEEKKILNSFETVWSDYLTSSEKIFQESSKGTAEGKAAALDIARGEARTKALALDHTIYKLIDTRVSLAEKAKVAADQQYRKTRIMTLFIIMVSFIISLGMGLLLSRSVARPLGELESVSNQIAKGDLTRNVPRMEGGDEISSLSRSVHLMVSNLREFITGVQEGAQMVSSSAQQLTANAQQNSAAATEAAGTVGEIATTMDQLSQNAQEVAALSEEASGMAEEGARGVDKVTYQMKIITETSEEASHVVESLSNTLNQVNQIVDLITHIADQTNLLALNAAIEAARAGEQGRGFAVVAEEVRKLAEQSASAAKEINQLITKVKAESEKAVSSMKEGNRQVKEGVGVVDEVGTRFKEIIKSIGSLTNQVQSVAAASEQVSSGVQNVASTTEEQTAAMEEVTGAAEQLSMLAVNLNKLAAKYKL